MLQRHREFKNVQIATNSNRYKQVTPSLTRKVHHAPNCVCIGTGGSCVEIKALKFVRMDCVNDGDKIKEEVGKAVVWFLILGCLACPGYAIANGCYGYVGSYMTMRARLAVFGAFMKQDMVGDERFLGRS